MSYILKALRKSEAERAKGTVPRLTTRHDAEPPPRRKLWPTLAGGALLANLGLVALVLWQPDLLPGQWAPDDPAGGPQAEIASDAIAGQMERPSAGSQVASLAETGDVNPVQAPPRPEEPAVLEQTEFEQSLAAAPAVLEPAAAPPQETVPEIGSDVRLGAVVPAPAKELVATEESAAPKPVTPKPVTPKPVTLGEFLDEKEPAEPAAREEPAPEEQPTAFEPPPRPKAKPAIAKQESRDQLAWAVPDLVVPAPPPAPEPPEPFADVPELWRLSPTFRQSVPEMTISVHVFSPEQSSRFIIIDRRKYLEGDRLNGGVLIEAILPQGVVFNLNGQQFKLISG